MMTVEFIATLAAAVVGGVTAHFISVHLQRGAVLGSAVIALSGGLVFPAIFGEIGLQLALAATTGSYAGMISRDKCGGLLPMALISLLAGTMFAVSGSVYAGVGGRLGTMAAISCLGFLGLRHLVVTMMASPAASKRESRREYYARRGSTD
ncbi:MAG: hypothetical protein R6U92_04345 [Bacillota bacterium]